MITVLFFQNWFLKSCDLIGQAIILFFGWPISTQIEQGSNNALDNLQKPGYFSAESLLDKSNSNSKQRAFGLPVTAASDPIHFLNDTNWESLDFEHPTKNGPGSFNYLNEFNWKWIYFGHQFSIQSLLVLHGFQRIVQQRFQNCTTCVGIGLPKVVT